MVTAEEAVVIAKGFLLQNYPNLVEETPTVRRPTPCFRPPKWQDRDIWEIFFRWKPVLGMVRSTRGCYVFIDVVSGEILNDV